MKFCKDCVYSSCDTTWGNWYCYAPINGQDNITGEYYPISCRVARKSKSNDNRCGENARYFKPKLGYRIINFFRKEK